MNILPKKSWHVRNKDNIAKVRHDEQEAANQEEKRLQQVALAEQEARTELLRKKARKHQSNALHSNTNAVSHTSQQSINFFQEFGPDGQPYSSSAANAEHEKEKKQEKEKAEKKLGVLTYLGQSAVETLPDDERPWYFKPPENKSAEKDQTKPQVADSKRKAQLDPLIGMQQHLKKKKKKHKHEHKQSRPPKNHSTTCHSHSDAKHDKLAKLRKERMEREAKEKQRSHQLLQKHFGSEDSDVPTGSSAFVPKYSNQFNPHIARTNEYT